MARLKMSALAVLAIALLATGAEIVVRKAPAVQPPKRPDAPRVLAGRDRTPVAVGGTLNAAIRLWELASGQEVARLKVPENSTTDLTYSPDGRFLVACCNRNTRNLGDQMIRIWDAVTGQEVRRFTGHLAAVWSVAFTADGRSVISGSADGTALVWDVSGLPKEPNAEPITADALKVRWNELASGDARVAYRAAWALSVPSAVFRLKCGAGGTRC